MYDHLQVSEIIYSNTLGVKANLLQWLMPWLDMNQRELILELTGLSFFSTIVFRYGYYIHAYHISRICINCNPALNGMKHHELRQWPARSLGSSACVWSLSISCIIEGLKILRDSGVSFFLWRNPIFEIWKTIQNRNLENKPDWALTQIFFCFCFIFPWFPRRGVAEPWGGPDRRELLGELVRCSEVASEPLFFPLVCWFLT